MEKLDLRISRGEEEPSEWKLLSLTGKDIKRCLFIITVVSVEDVADDHAGLAYSTVAHEHAAQFLPQPDGLVRSQTGLCHLLNFFSLLLLLLLIVP